jgi:hypothetical protein
VQQKNRVRFDMVNHIWPNIINWHYVAGCQNAAMSSDMIYAKLTMLLQNLIWFR